MYRLTNSFNFLKSSYEYDNDKLKYLICSIFKTYENFGFM